MVLKTGEVYPLAELGKEWVLLWAEQFWNMRARPFMTKDVKEGRNEGRMEDKQTIAMRLYGKGTKPEEIADIVDASVDLVRQWISTPGFGSSKRI